jgi:DNA-binding transcriptional MocR family regulator
MGRSLGLILDPESELPLYQQLFDLVAERIRSGAFPPGFRLPPSRQLAEELGTHRNTVVRAYSELERSGFTSSTVGRGTFVRAAAPPSSRDTASPPVASDGVLAWGSMISERARAEPFGRFHRITRSVGRGEYINLTRMQPGPELIPDDLFRRCLEHTMRTGGARALGYAPHEGVPLLRERIAADLIRQGVPARPDDVIVTSGSQQAIDVIARTILDPGDAVIAQEATYTGAIQIFAASGARLIGVPSDADGPETGWLRNLGRTAKAIYLMPNHCNPTGACIAQARRKEIVEWSRETGTPIIEDDYAADLELDGEPPPPAMRALDGDVIYVGTFSKKLIPALRIGFLVCPPALAPHLVALKHATDLGTSGLMQHALAEFLDRGYLVAHLERIRGEYRARRDAITGALRKHLPAGVEVHPPSRGTTIWLTLPEDVEGDAVFEEAKRRGVLVSPGSLYRVDRSHVGRGGVRLVFCYEQIPRLIEGAKRVGAAIEAVASRRRPRSTSGESLGVV